MLNALRSFFIQRATKSRMLQAQLDFAAACPLLELHERIVEDASLTDHPQRLFEVYNDLRKKWGAATIGKSIPFANDSMTIQLSEMFQHVYDIDAGDIPLPAVAPSLEGADRFASAAFKPSIGPSSHTNPAPTLQFQMKALYDDERRITDARVRDILTKRHGFSVWVGPSQAPSPSHQAGLYLKGRVEPGTIVALFPGAVYNSEMLQKPIDAGHLGNPAIPRVLIPRFDESVLDVHAAGSPKHNPYALAVHVRHPPAGIMPNVMRLQYDFIAEADGSTSILPFPQHLRGYIPNTWGAGATLGQSMYGALEQAIYAKGVVCIALRPLWDEELFVDHALNPYSRKPLPAWYRQLDKAASQRIWRGIAAR